MYIMLNYMCRESKMIFDWDIHSTPICVEKFILLWDMDMIVRKSLIRPKLVTQDLIMVPGTRFRKKAVQIVGVQVRSFLMLNIEYYYPGQLFT